MEEDIAPRRKKLKWQDQDHRRSVLYRQMWEKRWLIKKKNNKKEHEVSVFSHHPAAQLRIWTAQQERGNNIKPHSQGKQGSRTK